MANKSKCDIIFLQTDVRTFKREIVQAEDELIPEIQSKLLNIKREPVDGSLDMDVDVDADAVNDDGTSYTLAWNWVVINRSVDVFGVGVVLTRPLNLGVRKSLKSKCSIMKIMVS